MKPVRIRPFVALCLGGTVAYAPVDAPGRIDAGPQRPASGRSGRIAPMSSEPRPEPEPEREPESRPESADGPDRASDRVPDPAPSAYADRCYRSPAALAGGVALLLLAAWLGGDALLNGTAHTRLLTAAGLVVFVPLVVAYTLRPAVYANDRQMRVRNPFRTVVVPWGKVQDLRSGYSSEVVVDGAKYQLWSIPVSLRARKRAAQKTERAERVAARGGAPVRGGALLGLGRLPAAAATDEATEARAASDQAIDELRALAGSNAASAAAQGEVTVRWALEIAVPVLVGALALAAVLAAH